MTRRRVYAAVMGLFGVGAVAQTRIAGPQVNPGPGSGVWVTDAVTGRLSLIPVSSILTVRLNTSAVLTPAADGTYSLPPNPLMGGAASPAWHALYRNGLRQAVGQDYQIAGAKVTVIGAAWNASDLIVADAQY